MLQKEKDEAIFAAIDDSRMLGKLSVTKLMRLFGPVRTDGKGNPLIMTKEDQADGYVDPDMAAYGAGIRSAPKKTKKPKRAGAKDPKAAKGTAKGTNGAKGGPGSRGGKGAKAAKDRRDQAALERIERETQ